MRLAQPIVTDRWTPTRRPPLVLAGVVVPLALAASLVAPILLSDATRGPGTPLARLGLESLALLLGVVGIWLADQARVPPSVRAENLRVLLVLGGMVATMFAAAFLWLATLEVVGAAL